MRRHSGTLALLLFAAACSPRSTPPTETRAPAAADLATAPIASAATRDGYVGSAACLECHAKKRDGWQASWHARALAHADRAAVVGDFHGAHFAGSSSEAWMQRRGDRALMRTHGPDGALADFPVDWVIGGKRMQDDLTVFADGRWQVLPVYFQVTQKKWVDYTEAKQGRLAPDHPFYWTNLRRMANRECLDCHVTGLDVRFDRATRHWTTKMVEAGVACEDCHGPGARHADTTVVADIFSPKRGLDRAFDMCAQCHGPRNPLFPLLDGDHRFRPGQRYQDFYDPVVVLIAGRHSGDFFADGRPKSSSFEYQALLQSACHRKGGATCLSCHRAPHEPHGADELRVPGDESCRSCHPAELAAGATHTRHKQSVSCLGCHMPKVVSGVLDKFADHAIDVPVPPNSARHDVANACATAGCHADWKPDRVESAWLKLWPDAAARAARRRRLADAFDDKTAADSLRPLVDTISDASEAPTLRGAAALILAQRFADRAGAILPLLEAGDVTLRLKGCEALGIARARPAADALFARGSDDALPVRQAAALALTTLGDPRAESLLERLANDPASSHLMQPHVALARIALHGGDLARARAELETVARLTPYFAEALVQLARVAGRQGDASAARDWLDDARYFGANVPAADAAP
jgi:cytochrome c554/c'-like protein